MNWFLRWFICRYCQFPSLMAPTGLSVHLSSSFKLTAITAALILAVWLWSFAWLLGSTVTLLGVAIKLILPYTPCWSKEVKNASAGSPKLRIITANVLQTNRHYQALLDIVRHSNPDILVTLESDQHWQAQLDSLADILPYRVNCPQSNLYGMHVYSRYQLHHTAIEYIIEDDVPSIHSQITLPNGATIDFHFLHPAPPSPTENESAEPRDAELVVVAKRVAQHQRHHYHR